MDELRWDPLDHELEADPHPLWRRLRDEAPLYRDERHGFFALSRFADVMAAHLDPVTFINGRTSVLELQADPPPPPVPMIYRDPPEHTQLRKLVSRAFSPHRIAELESRIRRIAAQLLDPWRDSDHFDYAEVFAVRLPALVMASMLGVPEADREQARLWTEQLLARQPGPDPALDAVQEQLHAYLARYVAERRRARYDDMMGDLIDARIEEPGGERGLSDTELVTFIGLLISAGNETVARVIGWSALHLERWPGERRKLLERPGLIRNAVDELVRYEHPGKYQGRWVARDVVVHGRVLPAGSSLLLITASACRDPREFAEPDRLDVERRFDRQLIYGQGIHFCLGAALARAELRIALEETLARFPAWEVDGSGLERIRTTTTRGYAHVPIRPRRR
jgi:cytochrome P450